MKPDQTPWLQEMTLGLDNTNQRKGLLPAEIMNIRGHFKSHSMRVTCLLQIVEAEIGGWGQGGRTGGGGEVPDGISS